jgi:hypothetical protein
MSIDAMKQALEVLSLELPIGSHIELKNALRAAIEQTHGDWDEVEALRESLREHMAEIQRLRAALEQAQPNELMIWKSRAMSAERIIEKFMQPEQEPVFELGFGWLADATKYPRGTKLYATPPRQWQGLTDEELNQIYAEPQTHAGQYARAIEAKLKEKNT